MNIFSVFKNECIHNLRDMKGNVMMILFPVALILILGTALAPVFNSEVELDSVDVLYTNRAGAQLSEAYAAFVKSGSELGIKFEETDDVERGVEEISKSSYSCYLVLTENDDIKLYKNDRYTFEANLVEAVMRTFIERYKSYAEIAAAAPDKLDRIAGLTMPALLEARSLNKSRQPGALDYYAVSMLTMIILYSATTGTFSIRRELLLKTGNRLLCSPARKYEILTGKVLGCIVVTIIQALIVFVVSRFVLNAYWGENPAAVLMIIVSEAVMAVSIGIGTAFTVKNEGALAGIINTIIPIMVFLAGGYAPYNQLGKSIQRISVISPVKWTNEGLFDIIYNNDFSKLPLAIAINLTIAAVFILISALSYRREAV